MKNQKYGVEIELVEMDRPTAVKLMAELFGTNNYRTGSSGNYAIDAKGRTWKAISDGSLQPSNGKSCEIVTPILNYEDIELVQKVIRKLKANGAKVNKSCGIHVHVDGSAHTARSLWNLVNIMASKEDLLYKALGVDKNREINYCKKTEKNMVEELNRKKPTSRDEVRTIWYCGNQYHRTTRYHALNLQSLWDGKGVEFRCFNGSTHAGKIKAYIQLCLAINYQALTQKSARYTKTTTTNDKYTFRTWLLHLGLIGEEFETARKHLLAKLNGDTAFRYGRTRSAA